MLNGKVCKRSRWQHRFGMFCLTNTFFVTTKGTILHTCIFLLNNHFEKNQCVMQTCNRNLYRPCPTEYFHPLSKHCQLSTNTSLAAYLELFVICAIPTVYSSFYWFTIQCFITSSCCQTLLSHCFAFDYFLLGSIDPYGTPNCNTTEIHILKKFLECISFSGVYL